MNIAIAGFGPWGKNIANKLSELNVLHAICDIDPQSLAEAQSFYPDKVVYADFNELLTDDKIDGIMLATPAHTHFELAWKLLEAKKHVFVEKPFTMNSDHALKLADFAEAQNVTLMAGHLLEYHPAVVKIKEMLEQETIGKLKHIRCTRVNLGKIRPDENVWWSFAPHDLSIIFTLIDETPESFQAATFRPLQEGISDTVYVDLKFPGGQTAHIHLSWLEPIKLHQTVIVGEKAILVFNDTVEDNKLVLYKYSFDKKLPLLNKEFEEPIQIDRTPPLKLECMHFINCIASGQKPKTDARGAYKIIQTIETVNQKLTSDVKEKH